MFENSPIRRILICSPNPKPDMRDAEDIAKDVEDDEAEGEPHVISDPYSDREVLDPYLDGEY